MGKFLDGNINHLKWEKIFIQPICTSLTPYDAMIPVIYGQVINPIFNMRKFALDLSLKIYVCPSQFSPIQQQYPLDRFQNTCYHYLILIIIKIDKLFKALLIKFT